MADITLTLTAPQIKEFQDALGVRLSRSEETRSPGPATDAELSSFLLRHIREVVVTESTKAKTAEAERSERARLAGEGW